jgi:hypothetical protein
MNEPQGLVNARQQRETGFIDVLGSRRLVFENWFDGFQVDVTELVKPKVIDGVCGARQVVLRKPGVGF